ncbi:type I polyketide synthase, partial [Actinomadura rubrisoli]
TPTATQLLTTTLTHHTPTLIPAQIAMARLRGPLPPMLRGLVRTRRSAAADAVPELAALHGPELARAVQSLVRTQVSTVLGHSAADAVGMERAFKDLGFDSLTAVELRNRLNTATGLRLSATLVFDHPTPGELAAHLTGELAGNRAPKAGRRVASATGGDPIAVVAMGCRFPGGVASADGLWELVASGTDAIGEFPADRGWDLDRLYDADPDHTGTTYTRHGGFVHDAAEFDAAFFGMSPREALATDPQQRLLLETAWRTLEHGGIDPASLRGSRTGVFAGVIPQQYGDGLQQAPADLEGYLATGTTTSVASGRLSYTFGFEGPSVSIDTACSSSLVALHLAAQALRNGECDLALAGGATVMSSPGIFVELGRQRALAPDGRCRAFSADADGTGFAEGAGLVLLERLSDARRNGHQVLAVIRGSAVNQDGASNGLTAPNGPSQQRVIQAALEGAGLGPADVDAVEAHGTGTALGDPIEAQALLAAYGQDREAPLWLGSVKSNIGHTQAAAGVAAVIKMVMALRHGVLPRTLHADEPSGHIDWESGAVRLLTEQAAWPDPGRPRRAGVSSFGISGTNAHVIIEQAPASGESAAAPPDEGDGGAAVVPWTLSARTESAVREQARRLAEHVRARPEARPGGIARALLDGRARFGHRAAVVGGGRDELLAGLDALAAGRPSEQTVTGVQGESGGSGGVVFVFPGQGSQWTGMATELLAESPIFRDRMHACAEALAPHVGWSLTEELAGPLDRVEVIQPALWAVMVSLAELWRAHGVRPDAVIGHSQGEIAAAHVAGALSLEDSAKVVALRSRALTALAGSGAMASVALPADEVRARLEPFGGMVTVAAVNGPSSTVVAGEPAAVDEALAACAADGARTRKVPVDYASHSPHVDGLHDELLGLLSGLSPRTSDVAFHSTLTGGPVDTATLDAGYWFRNLRHTVRFHEAVKDLVASGHRTFVEASPHPVLVSDLHDTLDAAGGGGTVVPTLRREHGGLRRFVLSAAEAAIGDVPVDWSPLVPAAAHAGLPGYPFERERYWLIPRHGRAGDPGGLGLTPGSHPIALATTRHPLRDELLLTGSVSVQTHPWLDDHAVHGVRILPGTALLDLALHAGGLLGLSSVEDLTLSAPLMVPETGSVQIQVLVGAVDDTGRRPLSIHARSAGEEDADWAEHAAGSLGGTPPPEAGAGVGQGAQDGQSGRGAVPPEGAETVDLTDAYERLADHGYHYGPSFQGLRALRRDGAELYAEISLPAEPGGHALHPALLDAALHPLIVAAEADGPPRVPFAWSGVRLHSLGAGPDLRVRLTPRGDGTIGLLVEDAAGGPVLTVAALTVRPVGADLLASRERPLYEPVWEPLAAPTAAGGDVAVLTGTGLGEITGSPGIVVAAIRSAETHPVTGAHAAALAALELLQAWLADPRFEEATLVLATHGAVAAGPDETVRDLPGAAVWGLLRSAQAENPGRFVLLDTADPAAVAAAAVATGEPQLAHRDGRFHALRLAKVRAVPAPMEGLDGTVLITGGTGTLGALVARHLVTRHGARSLLLTSRRGPAAPGAGELAAELRGLGAEVTVTSADAADPGALAEVFAGHRVTAVVHAAGTIDDATVGTLRPDALAAVLRAKADTAWNLHRLAGDTAALILFSSATGVLGSPAQANYAAANAFLDALAVQRHGAGLPGAALAWGLWAEISAMTRDADHARVRRGGIRPMPSEEALELLDLALAAGRPVLVAAALEQPALRAMARDGVLPPIFRGLVRPPSARPPMDGAALAGRLAGLAGPERSALLAELVNAQIAGVLGHSSAAAIEPDLAFKDLGFDSLTAVELRNRLNALTGLRLPAATIFDHPTPAALTELLLSRLVPEASSPVAALLTDLDRIGSALARLDPADQTAVGDRLRSLARSANGHGGTATAERIQSSTAEEIFELIDNELS